MKVNFRQFKGMAGELDVLLICESEEGHKENCLYRNNGLFAKWRLNRARKRLIKRMELSTGKVITT